MRDAERVFSKLPAASTVTVVVTAFGTVNLRPECVQFVSMGDPDWLRKAHSKRYRSKHVQAIRSRLKQLEDAVHVTAYVVYLCGGVLTMFPPPVGDE